MPKTHNVFFLQRIFHHAHVHPRPMHHDQQQLQSVEFHHTDIREKEPSFKERDKREKKKSANQDARQGSPKQNVSKEGKTTRKKMKCKGRKSSELLKQMSVLIVVVAGPVLLLLFWVAVELT